MRIGADASERNAGAGLLSDTLDALALTQQLATSRTVSFTSFPTLNLLSVFTSHREPSFCTETERAVQARFIAPRPLRSLPEIQNEAQKLRETLRTGADTAERNAAAGLLSDTLDASALTQQLVTFRAKGDDAEGQEDVDAAATVEDYLRVFTKQATDRAMQVRGGPLLKLHSVHMHGTSCKEL